MDSERLYIIPCMFWSCVHVLSVVGFVFLTCLFVSTWLLLSFHLSKHVIKPSNSHVSETKTFCKLSEYNLRFVNKYTFKVNLTFLSIFLSCHHLHSPSEEFIICSNRSIWWNCWKNKKYTSNCTLEEICNLGVSYWRLTSAGYQLKGLDGLLPSVKIRNVS